MRTSWLVCLLITSLYFQLHSIIFLNIWWWSNLNNATNFYKLLVFYYPKSWVWIDNGGAITRLLKSSDIASFDFYLQLGVILMHSVIKGANITDKIYQEVDTRFQNKTTNYMRI